MQREDRHSAPKLMQNLPLLPKLFHSSTSNTSGGLSNFGFLPPLQLKIAWPTYQSLNIDLAEHQRLKKSQISFLWLWYLV